MKTIISSLEKFDFSIWEYHFPVPEAIAQEFIEGKNRRIICQVGDHEVRTALMKSKDYWYILVNKALRDLLNLEEGQRISLRIKKDDSPFGMEMPEELQVLLDQDPEGNEHFQNLTKGKQRNLIYIVNKVKNSNSRMNKALAIVEHLKLVKGHLDFKKLMVMIKFYNNLHRG